MGSREAVRNAVGAVLDQVQELEKMVSTADGDNAALHGTLNQYIARLAALHSSAADLTRGAGERYEVPVELVRYVDDGGNPDVWMAVAMRSTVAANQSSKGKVTAFRDFHISLERDLAVAFPEEVAQYRALKSTRDTPPAPE